MQLFIDRATSVRPHFVITNETAPAVAQLCVRLDDIPLALELAAVWIKMLSVEQVCARLSHPSSSAKSRAPSPGSGSCRLPFSEWPQIFGDERLTGALLDRLTHRVHIIEMQGESVSAKSETRLRFRGRSDQQDRELKICSSTTSNSFLDRF